MEDHPEPAVGDNDVLIEVGAVSVCGTDREMFEWSEAAQAFAPDLPVVLGHEFAGTVIGVAPGFRALDRATALPARPTYRVATVFCAGTVMRITA